MVFWAILCHNGGCPVGRMGMWVAISPAVRIGCNRVHYFFDFAIGSLNNLNSEKLSSPTLAHAAAGPPDRGLRVRLDGDVAGEHPAA